MTRLELLTIIVGRARSHGFDFRRWYTTRLELPWVSYKAALSLLSQHRHYYALLFSHDFANAFWKPGEDITFAVPSQTFQRRMADGTIQTVERSNYTRRTARRTAWVYHLKQMAATEEPLRYIRKYLNVEEDLVEDLAAAVAEQPPAAKPAKPAKSPRTKPIARPIPTDTPKFLRRPYVP